MKKDKKITKKEELVDNFTEKLLKHIDMKCSEAQSYSDSSDDSCWGFGSIHTQTKLSNSIKEMFGIPVEKEEEDEDYE